jgi:hypothetical protein
VFQYFIAGAASDEKRKTGRTFILYGIIGFVVMLSIWGLVNLLLATLGFGWGARPPIPLFGPSGGGSYYGGSSFGGGLWGGGDSSFGDQPYWDLNSPGPTVGPDDAPPTNFSTE